MFTVEMLPAGYGDALLVSWGDEAAPHHLLIDGGLASSYPAVARRLRALTTPVDLLVVTHIDRDHIGGVLKLLADDAIAGCFEAVWFNGRDHVDRFSDFLGVLDGEALSTLIETRGLPWNPGWPDPLPGGAGGPVVVAGAPPVVELAGGASLTLLSPTPARMSALAKEWDAVIRRGGLVAGRPARPNPVDPSRVFLGASLEDLAATRFQPDTTAANGSSIAFVLAYEGHRVLFGADAHAAVLLETLAALSPAGERYPLTACKVPHHGSRRNLPVALVQALDCNDWWLSTSGVRFGHPDPEALARILLYGRSPTVLRSNYASSVWDAFAADHPPDAANHPYELIRPPADAPGLLIDLTREAPLMTVLEAPRSSLPRGFTHDRP